MFQPERDQIPSQYDLMPPTLEAIYQLVGTSPGGVHYRRIDASVTEWITLEMPWVPVRYTNPGGSAPLLKGRLNSARSRLHEKRLIRKGTRGDGSNIQGHWALAPNALGLRQQLKGGGSPTGSQSVALRQTQGLAHTDAWTSAIKMLLDDERDITLERESPDGTIERIISKLRRR